MQDLISSAKRSMSSREVAELTGKEHSNVKRDISAMILQLNYPDLMLKDCPAFHPSELKGHNIAISQYEHCGNRYDQFHLDYEYTILLVSGYNVSVRQKIVKRWQELESNTRITLPQSFSEALQLAADQAKQLEEQAPKIEVYERLADRKSDVNTTTLAKTLGISSIKLNRWLKAGGYKWMSKDLPKAGYESWFNIVCDTRNGHEFTQCLITPKGQIEIAKRYNK